MPDTASSHLKSFPATLPFPLLLRNHFPAQLFVSRVVPFFFVLTDLANVRCFYQFGLQWFLALFRDALVTCMRSNSGPERLHSLTTHFTAIFYGNVSRSLFDDDKLPFAVLMLVRFLLVRENMAWLEAHLKQTSNM